MLPLKIAILWHQHQPYYKINGEYKLPWVRLHGIKDYLDLPMLLKDFPDIKQTFNVVPSMLLQLEDYASHDVNEKVLNLTRKEAALLSDLEKREILNSFFICNFENMIKPYSRFLELFNAAQNKDITLFTPEDWRDIQVWYLLTWFGPVSRENKTISNLLEQGRNYSEDDKNQLLTLQKHFLSQIVPTMKELSDMGQIEISVSPFYHPILPLLCDSNSALEAMPDNLMPSPPFVFPQDARSHLSDAVSYYSEHFGRKPAGLWPSEGSVSNEVLDIIAAQGIEWIATDEQIMLESYGNKVERLERFFPRRFKSERGELSIFFRDRLLSDLIGFSYSTAEPKEAARDFINRLMYVRWEISQKYGEDSLKYAVVPVILDGENCWEFYRDNGRPFLTELYALLTETNELQTVTYSEANDVESRNYLPAMENVRAGSWINADFDIWIGQKEHIKAWNALRDARISIEAAKGLLDDDLISQAMDEIHIAEGSDWFWWYCDRHQAPNKHDFDVMFRSLLKNVYQILKLDEPKELNYPFGKVNEAAITKNPVAGHSPNLEQPDENDWQEAGIFNASLAMDAMHSSAMSLSKVYLLNDETNIYLRLRFDDDLKGDEQLVLNIAQPTEQTVSIGENNYYGDSKRDLLLVLPRDNASEIGFNIKISSAGGVFNYPRTGYIHFRLV